MKTIRKAKDCSLCGKFGHISADCWNKKDQMKPSIKLPALIRKEESLQPTKEQVVEAKVKNYREKLMKGDVCNTCGHLHKKLDNHDDIRNVIKEMFQVDDYQTALKMLIKLEGQEPEKTRKPLATQRPKQRRKERVTVSNQKLFKPKQWRKEMYDHHLHEYGHYPKHKCIPDKKQRKFTTYHCGEWTRIVRNHKKDMHEEKKKNNDIVEVIKIPRIPKNKGCYM